MIPHEAVDIRRQEVLIEVVIILEGGQKVSIPMAIPLDGFRMVVWRSQADALAELRQWLIELAITRWIVMNPGREHDIARADNIFWLHGKRHERHPFLKR